MKFTDGVCCLWILLSASVLLLVSVLVLKLIKFLVCSHRFVRVSRKRDCFLLSRVQCSGLVRSGGAMFSGRACRIWPAETNPYCTKTHLTILLPKDRTRNGSNVLYIKNWKHCLFWILCHFLVFYHQVADRFLCYFFWLMFYRIFIIFKHFVPLILVNNCASSALCDGPFNTKDILVPVRAL